MIEQPIELPNFDNKALSRDQQLQLRSFYLQHATELTTSIAEQSNEQVIQYHKDLDYLYGLPSNLESRDDQKIAELAKLYRREYNTRYCREQEKYWKERFCPIAMRQCVGAHCIMWQESREAVKPFVRCLMMTSS